MSEKQLRRGPVTIRSPDLHSESALRQFPSQKQNLLGWAGQPLGYRRELTVARPRPTRSCTPRPAPPAPPTSQQALLSPPTQHTSLCAPLSPPTSALTSQEPRDPRSPTRAVGRSGGTEALASGGKQAGSHQGISIMSWARNTETPTGSDSNAV